MNKLMKTFRGITLAVGLLSCAGMMPASATAFNMAFAAPSPSSAGEVI